MFETPLAHKNTGKKKKGVKVPTKEDRIAYWRDKFLEDHKEYYGSVIANIGTNYKADESILKLQKAKSAEDLSTAWRLLSADERRDGEIIKVAQELKHKFKNEKV
jgi:hypothetical protein